MKSWGVKSGDRGGHWIGPSCIIQPPAKCMSRNSRTTRRRITQEIDIYYYYYYYYYHYSRMLVWKWNMSKGNKAEMFFFLTNRLIYNRKQICYQSDTVLLRQNKVVCSRKCYVTTEHLLEKTWKYLTLKVIGEVWHQDLIHMWSLSTSIFSVLLCLKDIRGVNQE
jgi:hypothetical protein